MMRSTPLLRILGLACAIGLCGYRAVPAAAQQPGSGARLPADAAPPPPPSFDDALDPTIDPETYRLGPGDHLLISIYARTPADYPAPVSPDGFIQLPTVGTIAVRGKTLLEVKRDVDQALRRVRKDFTTSIRVTRLHTIKVEVLGEVQKPGAMVCGAQTRVAEAVKRAELTGIASWRHVQLRRAGATLAEVDLERIWRGGDETTNLLLETGDRIFVPRAKAIVNVDGEVARPGDYECDEGDSVKDVIRRAGGVRTTGAATEVYVKRLGADDRRVLVRADLTRNPPPVLVQDRDHIFVPPLSVLQGRVRMVGAVKGAGDRWQGDPVPKEGWEGINTGVYLLSQGDHVRDAILNVGGPTSKADLTRAKLERPDGQGGKQVFAIDLHRLLAEKDDSENQELRDGDTLLVPTIVDQVYVLGQVLSPGAKQFEEGRTVIDYVSAAGGVGPRARKSDTTLVRGDFNKPETTRVRLDRMYAGKVDPHAVVVKPGDIIVIPEAQIKSWQDIAGILFSVHALRTGLSLFGIGHR